MLDIVLNYGEGQKLDLPGLKLQVKQYAAMIKSEADYDRIRSELLQKVLLSPPIPKVEATVPDEPVKPVKPGIITPDIKDKPKESADAKAK